MCKARSIYIRSIIIVLENPNPKNAGENKDKILHAIPALYQLKKVLLFS